MGKSGLGAKSQGSGGYDEALATAGDRHSKLQHRMEKALDEQVA